MSEKSIEDVVASFAGKLEALVVQHGGEAWELALLTARVDAASHLLWGLMSLIAGIVLYKLSRYSYNKAEADNSEGWGFACIISGGCGAFAVIACFINWVNLWVWVGVFEPKLWLAYKILEL